LPKPARIIRKRAASAVGIWRIAPDLKEEVAIESAQDRAYCPRYLLRLCELERIDRERRTRARIRLARFPRVKSLDTFDFVAACQKGHSVAFTTAAALIRKPERAKPDSSEGLRFD
jgi:DNA replication protein DnaC